MSATKDRLCELKRIQNGEVEVTIETNTNIDKILQKAETIRGYIDIIEENTKRANDILKDSLFVVSKVSQDELDSIFTNNISTSYKINTRLKELQNEIPKTENENSADFRIIKLQYTTLTESFKKALEKSTSCLEYHRDKKAEILKKSLKTVHKEVNEVELEALLDDNKLDTFIDNHLTTTAEAKLALNCIEERHKELIKIEKCLTEVSGLFLKLATLVEQQKESIDRVEYHAATATTFVENGTKDIAKTVKSKKKWNKWKVYILLIFIIVLLVIILIFSIK